MTENETTLFSLLGGFGLVTGLVIGSMNARKGRPVSDGVGLAMGVAILLPLVIGFICTAADAVMERGYSLIDGLKAGWAAAFLLLIGISMVCGIPAAIAAWGVGLICSKTSPRARPPDKDK